MKIYISYKFTGADPEALKQQLQAVTGILEKSGNSTFIYFRDVQNWQKGGLSTKEIIKGAFSAIDKQDSIFALVDSPDKSEGMLLEVGYAKALGKKLIVAIQKEAGAVFLRDLADELIEYKNIDDLLRRLNTVKMSA